MEKRLVELDQATAERWLQGGNEELKDLALQTFPELEKKKLPKSWEELEKINGWYSNTDSVIDEVKYGITSVYDKNVFATKAQAEASIALAQLSQLREVYRDGWKPDWGDENQAKFVIDFYDNKIAISLYIDTSVFLSFQSAEVRDEFLNNFRDLIEQAKPLMS
jgi:hypothetical protein